MGDSGHGPLSSRGSNTHLSTVPNRRTFGLVAEDMAIQKATAISPHPTSRRISNKSLSNNKNSKRYQQHL